MKETISLERTAKQSAIALAEKALECITSQTATIVTGVVAVAAILIYLATEQWSAFTTVAVMAFAIQFALMATVDIEKGGLS